MTALYKQKLPRRPGKDFCQAFVRHRGGVRRQSSQLPLEPGALRSLRRWVTNGSSVYTWPSNHGSSLMRMNETRGQRYLWMMYLVFLTRKPISHCRATVGTDVRWEVQTVSGAQNLGFHSYSESTFLNTSAQHTAHWFPRLTQSQ